MPLVALLVACSVGSPPPSGIVSVAAAFAPLAEAAERIGGDRVQVADLTPPGAEPHDLELTPSQIGLVKDAGVLVYLGGGFQPAVEELAGQRTGSSVDLHSGGDPHIWLDPVAWRDAVSEIAEALSEADPDGKETYARNAGDYRVELAALDADYRTGLRECRRRVIVTAHDAFGRLARRYGLEQLPIAGISPDAEPSARRLAELRTLVRERGVATIFTETLVSPRVAEALARETGAKTAVLNPAETLGRGETYLSVMLENLRVLRRVLECAP